MKKVKIRSAVPIYLAALTWVLFGLLSPIYEWLFILIAAGASMAVYLVTSVLFPGRVVEKFDPAQSGDAQVDRQIEEGRKMIRRIVEANEAIPDAKISACMDRMQAAGEKIFEALEKDVGRASQVRKFMNYYLPATDKLLTQYQLLNATKSGGENVRSAMQSVENSMDLIAQAF